MRRVTIKTVALAGKLVEMIWLAWQSLGHVTTAQFRLIQNGSAAGELTAPGMLFYLPIEKTVNFPGELVFFFLLFCQGVPETNHRR